MKSPLIKISLIILLIIVLPATTFMVIKISQLSESDQAITEIYSNQLSAVLYSVNQYLEDVTSSWANEIEQLLRYRYRENEKEYSSLYDTFFNINPSIKTVFVVEDATERSLSYIYQTGTPLNQQVLLEELNKMDQSLQRLITYKRGKYTKIQPMLTESLANSLIYIFILDAPGYRNRVAGIVVDKNQFGNSVLTNKINDVAGDDFILAFYEEKTNELLYANEPIEIDELEHVQKTWMLPGVLLGISLREATVEEIAAESSRNNLIMVIVLNLTLLLGAWLVYTNIRREIELVKIKSDFVSNVSHELRTPLALVSMFAETLELGRVPSEERKQEYYRIISQETNRLSRIVNKILNFSKMEAGRRTYNFEVIDLNEIVSNVYGTYSFHMKNNGFEANLELADSLPPVKADPEAVAEALINLIDNAMKYSTDEKSIAIRTGMKFKRAFIEVEDKGMGISDDDQKKIFDKFYRVTEGSVHNTKGAGLGLSLVKHIVDAHHGSIDLQSAPGKGSTFTIRLPFMEKDKS